MKALTIWQPWASLIMIGAKPYEWRRWRSPGSLVGERIVIHAGKRKMQAIEVYQLRMDCLREARQIEAGGPVDQPTAMDLELAIHFLEDVQRRPSLAACAAGLGTAILGEAKLASDLGFPVDSDRLDEQNWGWPLTAIELFEEPIPMRGSQGIWNWPEVATVMPELLI